MRHFIKLRKQAVYVIAIVVTLFLTGISSAQTVQSIQAGPLRPNLGTASTYAIFTGGGAINNTGLSKLTGDVGQDGAYSFNGFPPGTYTGMLNRNNGASALAKSDLLTAWTNEAAVPCGIVLGVGIVNGQTLTPAVYCAGGAATTTGNITFDAQGDAGAIFIVKIGGQLDANSGTHILLANNAQALNIYWFVDGAVNIAENSTFKGVIIARGAITFLGTSSLDGRALATVGAINISANSMGPFPPGAGDSLIVTHPALGDTLTGGTQNYQITWTGSGITSKKIFEYSLDSGLSWKTIDTFTTDQFTHNWNIPDTVSKKALVRITDGNNLKGVSGLFTIVSSKSSGGIVILRPAAGEIIVGGTQNYQITWRGIGIASQKTFEYSLDSGTTWKIIGTTTSDVFTFNWNVPDTASTKAIIRISDQNGLTGKSGIFTIVSSKGNSGSIIVTHPIQAEMVDGGTQNFMIMWTGTGISSAKTIDLSLDGGITWKMIATISTDAFTYNWNVPDTVSTLAVIRITDQNGNTGKSGIFTILKASPGNGSINSLTLSGLDNNNNIGNNQPLGISWTFTPDIGTSVEVEYSVDYTATWQHIATVQVSESPSTSWMTPITGNYNPVFIRVISSKGMSRNSIPFSIGSNASVSPASKNGYSVSNYPNPASSQTMINFILPVASDVNLTIIDGLGREMSTVVKQHFNAGTYNIQFDASKLSAGMYSYILQAGATRVGGKMTIIK